MSKVPRLFLVAMIDMSSKFVKINIYIGFVLKRIKRIGRLIRVILYVVSLEKPFAFLTYDRFIVFFGVGADIILVAWPVLKLFLVVFKRHQRWKETVTSWAPKIRKLFKKIMYYIYINMLTYNLRLKLRLSFKL